MPDDVHVVVVAEPRTTVSVAEGGAAAVVVTETVERAVEVGVAGPQGIRGPQGPPGGSSASYRHEQASPSATWTVAHNLGFPPNVTVVDTLGRRVWGDVAYPNDNTAVLTFSAPFSGTAYLS